jgi:hypothetical protein
METMERNAEYIKRNLESKVGDPKSKYLPDYITWDERYVQ